MNKRFLPLLMITTIVPGCSLAPDFKLPDMHVPDTFKEQTESTAPETKGRWQEAKPLEKEDRGQWWKIFGDERLNDLETQAQEANQTLKVSAARVLEARATAESNSPSFLPDVDIGGNAVRSETGGASLAAFGFPAHGPLRPYNLYTGQATLSYEADLFGSIRDNYKAYSFDADAEAAAYRSTLLALQADVAQNYFAMCELDSERQLLREAIEISEEAVRIMQHRFNVGAVGQDDLARMQSQLASRKADLNALDRQRSISEHALAVLLGKLPSEFSFAPLTLATAPPMIPSGLPSTLLERRPDITAAQSTMAAANARIGVARAAFFPSLSLTAFSGFQSTDLSSLFKWTSRTWALGQTAGTALAMPIFDSGHNMARLDASHAAYEEALANYRQQVLVAFRDVEDNLTNQHVLADQSQQQDLAATASNLTTTIVKKRYQVGEVDFFEVVTAENDSLAASRAAIQVKGQRYLATVGLIRALGGGWDIPTDTAPTETKPDPVEAPVIQPQNNPPALNDSVPSADTSPII